MSYLERLIEASLKDILERGKSVMLLGPRQTGKTTLVERSIKADLSYSFLDIEVRQRLEKDPQVLLSEIKGLVRVKNFKTLPLVLIDEVQKVPEIMDTVQLAVDRNLAKFVLTGSSARKLRRGGKEVNLLPGRVIELYLSSLSFNELCDESHLNLEDLLLNGSLPEVFLESDPKYKELLLRSYVNTYLEEEVRAEALVRNLSSFSKFLAYAAVDAGKQLNMSNISREIGVSRHTIESYYQILEDCLIVDRIDPIIETTSRRRLMKSPKYLFFDLGVRRIAAGEGLRLPLRYMSELFEQFVGAEIMKLIKVYASQARCRYWRDYSGVEVDYVVEYNQKYLPLEVKWKANPTKEDARHLYTFMDEHECISPAYIICQTPRPMEISENVLAVSWKEIPRIILQFLEHEGAILS